MGESTSLWPYSIEHDFELMNRVSSVNLACGYHAGDASVLKRLVERAFEKGVKVGAHPSYPDRENFGRSSFLMAPSDLYAITLHQLASVEVFVRLKGLRLHHVKPHGALYNRVAHNEKEATAFLNAVRDFDPRLTVYGLSGSLFLEKAEAMGLKVAHEAFADRRYLHDGSLVPRSDSLALIDKMEEVLEQVLRLAKGESVQTADGKEINIKADTICVHSDSVNSLKILNNIHKLMTISN